VDADGEVPEHTPAHVTGAARLRMAHLRGVVSGARPGRMRDRRGRGARGPMALPGPLSPDSVPSHLTPRQDFDALVEAIVDAMSKHFEAEPDRVDIVTEEAPLLPDNWSHAVPTSASVRGPDAARVILYRLPLTKRCSSRQEIEDATWKAVLDRLAEIWQVSADDLDPRPH
jgi:phenylpyruvate tautomerase PptA (4-oxalocrotonate tautomerase family)